MKKILITLFLSLSLLAAIPLGAGAIETAVRYSVDGSYTVKIPNYIEADTDGETLEITNAVIPFDYEITVSADYDGRLHLEDEPSVTLPYKLFVNENEYTSGSIIDKTHRVLCNEERVNPSVKIRIVTMINTLLTGKTDSKHHLPHDLDPISFDENLTKNRLMTKYKILLMRTSIIYTISLVVNAFVGRCAI